MQAKAAMDKDYDLVLMDYQMPGMNGIETSRKIREKLENIELPKIVMVTGFGREEIMRQSEKVGLQGFLIKPVSPSMLYDTIMEVFGKNTGLEDSMKQHEDKKPEGFRKIQGARLLLIEDNEINQQVAVETLEQEGFHVDVADDGRAGIDRLNKENNYDLVLMDLQMPVMDGYEATIEIRKDDKYKNLAIIAMTADAMTGVREQVLKAGMNDYVTKPINPKELWEALTKWIKPGDRKLPEGFLVAGEKSGEEIIIPDIDGVDTEEGLSHVGGNKKLYLNLLSKFRDEYGDAVRDIRKSLEKGDREAAVRGAHTVKGVAGNIGAKEVQQAAAVVEAALKEETESDAEIEKLNELLSGLIRNLKKTDLEVKVDSGSEESKTEMDPKILKELLEELKPVLEKRKPKPSKEIIEKINTFKLSDELIAEFEKLSKFAGKYKFKDAVSSLEIMLETIIRE
jgi:polar amino acid transport system substrate-binding protein